METRHKLTENQLRIIREAQQQVELAKVAYQTAVAHADVVGNLITEFYGVPTGVPVTVEKDELVVRMPDPPVPAPAK